MLEIGGDKIRKAGLANSVDTVVANACYLPFRERCFDRVFSRGVAISYASDPARFATESWRVLEPKGALGLDFINGDVAAKVKRKICRFERVIDHWYYVEMFSEGGRQKRIGYRVPDEWVA